MTEPSPAHAPKSKKRNYVVPVAIAILAVAVFGFFLSRAGLDKALVKQQLDDFAAQLKEQGKAQGRDLSFTYGELEVQGSFIDKHVVVHQPALGVKPLNPVANENGKKSIDAIIISSPVIEIYPGVSSLTVKAPQPIDVASQEAPDKSLLKITSNIPMTFISGQKKVGEVTYKEFSFQSPTEMLLTYLREQQAKGSEETTPAVVPVYDEMTVAVAQGSGFSSSVAVDGSGLGEAKLYFKDMVFTPKAAPEGAIKIADLSGNWTNVLNEKKLNVVHSVMALGPVTSTNAAAPYLPITLNMDATFEGMVPKTPDSVASMQPQESVMQLKQFALTTKDASLSATANFTANSSDMLPVGTANITLTNLQFVLGELRKYNLLNAQNEPLVMAVVQQVAGMPVEQVKDLVIPIERMHGGAFKIGQSTFEELFAVMLKNAMLHQSGQAPVPAGSAPAAITAPETTAPASGAVAPAPGASAAPAAIEPPHVPQLPDADKPKAAPIEVPDHGVRG